MVAKVDVNLRKRRVAGNCQVYQCSHAYPDSLPAHAFAPRAIGDALKPAGRSLEKLGSNEGIATVTFASFLGALLISSLSEL